MSSPDVSGDDNAARTPDNPSSSFLSPPNSQHRTQVMPTAATGSSIANSNGKRPIQTISNGVDDMEGMASPASIKSLATSTNNAAQNLLLWRTARRGRSSL